MGGGVGGRGIEQKRKKIERTHGHRQQCGNCGGKELGEGGRGYREGEWYWKKKIRRKNK